MRHIAVLFILVFFAAFNAGAQSSASVLPLAPSFSLDSTPAASTGIRLTPFAPAADLPLPAASVVNSAAASSTPLSLSLAPKPDPAPQDVTSVFQTYNWQAYLGYTFFRFYELPSPGNYTLNMNGFDINMVYYFKNWVGAEGDLSATHANQAGESSWFAFGGGGPRFRWSARRGIEVWAHALVGYSHFTPQTAFGNQHALAYTFGGGVDLPFKDRWSLRAGVDGVGTQYFNTHQWSPKASVGIVFKF
ncbi:MAG TPA: hypothetical protein VGD60_10600 [Candidatus Acidoferrales bacterium]